MTLIQAVALSLISAVTGVTANPFLQIERLEAARSLGNGALAGFVNSGDRRVAVRAALAIGRTKKAAGIPLLARHAGDRDTALRAMSIYSLGLIGGIPATAPVLDAL